MEFTIILTQKANDAMESADPKKKAKIVRCLAKLGSNPRHPGLNSHSYAEIRGPLGEQIWESYVENNTTSAWRVWWFYGPEQGEITVYLIAEHP